MSFATTSKRHTLTQRAVRAAIATVLTLALAPAAANAAVTFKLTGAGTYLNVFGTGSDSIAITCGGDGKVKINGATDAGIGCKQLTGLGVQLGSGGGTANLSGVTAAGFDGAQFKDQLYIAGGSGDDTIIGSPFGDWIDSQDGDDSIDSGVSPAGGRKDSIWPGRGSDSVIGQNTGTDELRLTAGEYNQLSDSGNGTGAVFNSSWAPQPPEADSFSGIELVQVVDDLYDPGSGNQINASAFSRSALQIEAGPGNDEITGPKGKPGGEKVYLGGGGGEDVIKGGKTAEQLDGGIDDHPDDIDGGDGADTVVGVVNGGEIDGGPGIDRIVPSLATLGPVIELDDAFIKLGGKTSILTAVEQAEIVASFKQNQDIDASSWSGSLTATTLGGNDTIVGGSGPDYLTGGDGDDTITGGGGVDWISAGIGSDTIHANDGAGDLTLACGDGNDVLYADQFDPASFGCESINPAPPVQPQDQQPADQQPQDPPAGSGDQPAPQTMPPGPQQQQPQQQVPAADTLAPRLALMTTKVDRRGQLSIRVTCPAGETRCAGTASLTSAKKVGKKKLAFGTRSFSIAGGQTATLELRLSKKNLALLRKKKRIAAIVSASAMDAAGNRGGGSLKVTLKRA